MSTEDMSTEDKTALDGEFDALMARAGVVVPADRKAGVVAGFEDLRRLTALLRQPRTAASEPSNIYSLKPFIRKA
jgi:hypothetical protein